MEMDNYEWEWVWPDISWWSVTDYCVWQMVIDKWIVIANITFHLATFIIIKENTCNKYDNIFPL